jgi:RecB family exonuclease
MIVDRQNKTITIVDYKTGKSYRRWAHEAKLHRYRLQLYLYKTLVERSHTWAGFRVEDAYLEFVEPDEEGAIQELHLEFSQTEQAQIEQLTEAIWQRIQRLQIPNTGNFTSDIKGIEEFERNLLQGPQSEL